jgi:hypothetical protein
LNYRVCLIATALAVRLADWMREVKNNRKRVATGANYLVREAHRLCHPHHNELWN